MRFFPILYLILFYSRSLLSQSDSVRAMIVKAPDPKNVIIMKGRQLVLEKFIKGDRLAVKSLLNYLVEKEDSLYIAFFPNEKWLLWIWAGEYDKVIQDVSVYDLSYSPGQYWKKIYPSFDELAMKLETNMVDRRTSVKDSLLLSEKNEGDRLLISLIFDNELRHGMQVDQDSINQMADKFLLTDPNPELAHYVRKYVRFKYQQAKWWGAYDFFAGCGIMTGDLSNDLMNGFLWGIGGDIGYKNFVLFLRNNLGFSKTRDSIPFGSITWTKHSKAEIFLPEASVGYKMRLTNKLELSPFIGIASMNIAPPSNDVTDKLAYKNVGFRYTTTLSAGINVDLWPGKQRHERYWHVRLRYSFNAPDFASKYAGLNGYYHSIVIGMGGYGRRHKRVE